ncbi:MAG: hypothetical protein ACJAS9_000609 [Polaribacter sp.]
MATQEKSSFLSGSLTEAVYIKMTGLVPFSNVTDDAGVRQGFWAWGSCFADFNGDGYEYLLVVNGFDGMTEAQSFSRDYASYNNDPALL